MSSKPKKKSDQLAAEPEKKHERLTPGGVTFNVINYVIFGILTFICAYPFYYLIINSISANNLSENGVINFWPQGIHFDNY
ncbi:MAG: carbohydrate ABC transporter permease, partial [Oscillospiraceae bacterium]|nr:carbohydrate ABC transporter permease [Oscillospiraceae bacterium]